MSMSENREKFVWIKALDPIFVLTVGIPTLCATLYFGLLASDVYVSESRFVVRSPEKPATTGFGVLLKTAGFSNAGDEIYATKDFITSRDALRALNADGAFSQDYGARSISIFDRFDPTGYYGSFEDLYRYYSGKVSVEHDNATTITKLVVRAYTPQAAYRFNAQLLDKAEAMVNRLNARGREDLIRFGEAEVAAAEGKARAAALALSAYRNRKGVVDPERQAQIQLQMISKLQDGLITAKAQRAQLRAFAPRNPQIAALDTQIATLEREMADQSSQVAGNQTSLAATAAPYQRLQLEAQFADKQLASALASLEEARNEAGRKQAYVERIVSPNLPDSPAEPRRLRGIVATFLIGLVIWGVVRLLISAIKEHQD